MKFSEVLLQIAQVPERILDLQKSDLDRSPWYSDCSIVSNKGDIMDTESK